MSHPAPTRRPSEDGYILLGVLILLALFILAMAVTAPRIAAEIQRDRELETMHRGKQYIRAVQLYYRKFNAYPPNIDALVKTNEIKFLRKRYTDPLTGKDDWKPIMFCQNKAPLAMGFFGQPLGGMSGCGPIAGTGPTGGNGLQGSGLLPMGAAIRAAESSAPTRPWVRAPGAEPLPPREPAQEISRAGPGRSAKTPTPPAPPTAALRPAAPTRAAARWADRPSAAVASSAFRPSATGNPSWSTRKWTVTTSGSSPIPR